MLSISTKLISQKQEISDLNNQYHILHIFSGYGGGISSVILNLAENKTDDFQYDLLGFTYRNGEQFCGCLEKCGVNCYTMPRPRVDGVKTFFNFLDTFFSEHHYDAVHCHISGWMALPFSKYAKKHGVKHFFIHAHTTTYDSMIDRFPLVRCIDQMINYRLADCYFTCSDLAANYIFGKRFLRKKKTVFVPNGIKKDLFRTTVTDTKAAAYREEFSIEGDCTVIGHVGRFSPPKNHDEVLNIAKQLLVHGYRFVLLLIGDGERFEEVRAKAHELGLDNVIRFVGRRIDIPDLMQFFDIMILPSFWEGLPTVAVECQAAGTPIVMSDTITHQCDMGLGLTTFLPLNETGKWTECIITHPLQKKVSEECVEYIDKIGFTATAAGVAYCHELGQIMKS